MNLYPTLALTIFGYMTFWFIISFIKKRNDVADIAWGLGFYFESTGDRQLKEFIFDPKNKGKLMDKGLWQYSRHPNYFGEVTQMRRQA